MARTTGASSTNAAEARSQRLRDTPVAPETPAPEFTHGIRLPPFTSYGLFLGAYPYGVIPAPLDDANVPTNNGGIGRFAEIPLDRFLYERLDWKDFVANLPTGNGPFQLSNPPFLGAGQLLASAEGPSWMYGKADTIYGPGAKPKMNRILRGYIRRRDIDNPGDPKQYARLYFMYNPEQIQRTYLSWQDVPGTDGQDYSGAAGNMNYFAAATVDFSLFFDRQVEVAKDSDHPGTLVDLQVFDVLARKNGAPGMRYLKRDASGALVPAAGAVEGTESQYNNTDTFMLGIGTDFPVAVVFSPNLIFEGWIKGAACVFEKFDSRMVPTRMTLTISLTLLSVVTAAGDRGQDPGIGGGAGAGGASSGTTGTPVPANVDKNARGRQAAADFAYDCYASGRFSYDSGAENRLKWFYPNPSVDCSSFIYYVYTHAIPPAVEETRPAAAAVLWPRDLFGMSSGANTFSAPNTATLTGTIFRAIYGWTITAGGTSAPNTVPDWPTWSIVGGAPWDRVAGTAIPGAIQKDPSALDRAYGSLAPGDLLIKSPSGDSGHIVMVYDRRTDGQIRVVHAAGKQYGVIISTYSKDQVREKFEYAARPQPYPERQTTTTTSATSSSTSSSGDWRVA